jgi:hypothetical protein
MQDGSRERRSRGGIDAADSRLSAGGRLVLSRDELVSGECDEAFAPLVPGVYEYEVTVSFPNAPDEIPLTLALTVDPLPPVPDALEFLGFSMSTIPRGRRADYRFVVAGDRCYPYGAQPMATRVIVIDAATGRVRSERDLNTGINYEGSSEAAIDRFNCLPAGVIRDRVVPPAPDVPGDWHLALVVGERDAPVCRGGRSECGEPGAFNSTAYRILAIAPFQHAMLAPEDGDFYFERITEQGPRPVAEAAIGDLVRVVLEDPAATTERQVAITAGNQTKFVDLEPDGDRLVSEIFVLGLEEGD